MQIKHCLQAFNALIAFALAAMPTFVAAHPLPECKTGYVEWERRGLDEIVANSPTIFLATAEEFVPDQTRPGFDGYYVLLSTGVELKGGGQGKVVVYGQAPYQIPPQHYFDLSAHHKQMVEAFRQSGRIERGGVGSYTQIGTHWPIAPRLVLGYQYLVLLGTDSRLSFEPINDLLQDEWRKLVTQLALGGRR